MKTPLSILYILFIVAASSCAQNVKEPDVPLPVKQQFQNMHPNAKEVKWSKEEGMFEAEYEEGDVESSIVFQKDGTAKQIESEIAVSALPEKVSDYVKQHLGGKKIKEAAKITDASGEINFEAEVGGDDYIFDAEGNFLKKESKDSQEDDDE